MTRHEEKALELVVVADHGNGQYGVYLKDPNGPVCVSMEDLSRMEADILRDAVVGAIANAFKRLALDVERETIGKCADICAQRAVDFNAERFAAFGYCADGASDCARRLRALLPSGGGEVSARHDEKAMEALAAHGLLCAACEDEIEPDCMCARIATALREVRGEALAAAAGVCDDFLREWPDPPAAKRYGLPAQRARRSAAETIRDRIRSLIDTKEGGK